MLLSAAALINLTLAQWNLGAESADKRYLPGLVRLVFKGSATTEQVDNFAKRFGIRTTRGFKYDPNEVTQSEDPSLIFVSKGAPPPSVPSAEVLVPVGAEKAWVEIFSRDALVTSAVRIEFDPTLSGGSANWKPPKEDWQGGYISFSTKKEPEEVLNRIEAFLKDATRLGSKFPDKAKGPYPDSLAELAEMRGVLWIDNIQTAISPGWQRLRFDVGIGDPVNGARQVGVSVSGKCASGIGSTPPKLDQYKTQLVPKFAAQLQQYLGTMKSDLTSFVETSD